jgi:pimeloyl-ACP methyl ester carboxylesterase
MIKEVKEHFFNFDDDVKIYYEIHGKGERILLCIHGYGSSHESWYDILPYLSNYFTLILFDLKGFGLSSKPDDNKYGVSDHAEIIFSLIEKLTPGKVTVIGHSYGAAIALAAYLKARTLNKTSCFEKLLLIDAALFIDDLPVLKMRLREPFLKKIILKFVPAKIIAKISLRRMFYEKSKVTEKRVEYYAKYIKQQGTDISFIKTALLMYPDIQSFIVSNLDKIDIPVLIIWGENDPLFPVTHAYKLNGIIGNSSLKIITQCGHAPQEERPGKTAEIITNFLRKLS